MSRNNTHNIHTSRRRLLALALTTSMITPMSVQAEEAGDDDTFTLEEIIVTAQKREQALQDAPIAITALGGEALKMRGLVSITDMAKYTPNFVVSEQPGSSNASAIFTIRGATTNDILISSDNAVAIYIDGVAASKSIGVNFDLADIERIEVLRGPQGTMFGKNSVGGAISVISKKPTGELGMEATITGGSDNLRSAKGHLNLPAIGTSGEGLGILSVKLSGLIRKRDGLFGSTEPGVEDYNNLDRHGFRAYASWEMNDRFSINYIFDTSKATENSTAFQITNPLSLPFIDSFSAAAAFASEDRLDNLSGVPLATLNDGTPFQDSLFSNSKASGHNITAKFALTDNIEIKWISGFRKTEVNNAVDLDATPLNIAQFTLDYELNQESHELQIGGATDDDAFTYVVGAYLFKEDGSEDALNHMFLGAQENRSHLAIDNKGTAIYGQVEWVPDFVDGKLTITLGARVSKDDREATKTQNSVAMLQAASLVCDDGEGQDPCILFDAAPGMAELVDAGLPAGFGLFVNQPAMSVVMPGDSGACTSFDPGMPIMVSTPGGNFPTGNVAPGIPCLAITSFSATHNLEDLGIDRTFLSTNLTIQYQWTDDVKTYVKYATGYRAPGFNGRAAVASAFETPFGREELKSYEAGLKAKVFDNSVHYNLAVFYSDYKDRLRTIFVPASGSNQIFNALKAKLLGFEGEVVAMLSRNLTVNLGYGYLNGSSETDPDAIARLGFDIPSADDHLIHAPSHTLSGGVQWDQDLSIGSLTVRVDFRYKSEDFMTPSNNIELFSEDGFVTLDARISWQDIEVGRSTFDLSLWAKNLTDTKYRSMGIDFQLYLGNNYGAPRTWGLDLTARF